MSPAEYAIEIAARMTGAEQTSAKLDELTAGLRNAGKGASHFQEAIVKVSADLDVARAASLAANTALADGTAEYKTLERAAAQAGKSLDNAAKKAGGVVPSDLKAKADAASAALSAQASALRGLEAAAEQATAKETALAKTLGNVRTLSAHTDKSLSEQAERMSQLRGAVGSLGGPLGTLGSQVMAPVQGFQMLSKSVGASRAAMIAGAAGVVALVVACVALTAAVIAGTIAVAKWAVSLADSARSSGLALDAYAAMNPELRQLVDVFAEISGATGLATDRLRGLHKSLKDARVSVAAMPAALRAAALAEAALGQGGAQDFIEQIKAGTLTVRAFANEAESKFGGIVARQMLGLEAQGSRLKYNFREIFGGLNIDPALEGMQVLVSLFDKNTAAGSALKFLFETIFQPLIDKAKVAAQIVEAFALGVLIGLMKMYLFVKPVMQAVGELFGFDDFSLESVCKAVTMAGKILAPVFVVAAVAFGAFAAAVVFVVTAVMVAVTAVTAVTMAIAALPMIILTAVQAGLAWVASLVEWRAGFNAVIAWLGNLGSMLVGAVVNATNAVIAYFGSIDWAQLGRNIITGLVNGITGSAGAVVNAIGGAVQGAINKAKSLLGIASPSKVFAAIGEYTGEGFAQGVDESGPVAQSALASMVDAPTTALSAFDALSGNVFGGGGAIAPAAQASTPAQSGSAGGVSINLAGATLTFSGLADAPAGIEKFAEMLTRLIEGDAAQLGAATT
jgi:hypothetical protein